VGNAVKTSFDPKVFLAKVGKGKTTLNFHSNQKVFAQGEVADTVFYIQKGRVKVTVVSEHGKEAVVGILETPFCDALAGHRDCAGAERW
jgi:CRP/FNR family transcriptional regulator, cyclic AMP receptor protein